MESDRAGRLKGTSGLAAGIIAGALLGGLATIALGYAIDGVGVLLHDPAAGHRYREWLSSGGWAWPSIYGAAIASMRLAQRMSPGRGRIAAGVLGILLALLPVVWRPFVPEGGETPLPASAEGKIRAIRRFSYRSPATVARLLPLSRDPDVAVRARATLALGVNLIVTDIERDRPAFPSRHAADPLRDSLRIRLAEALVDPVEEVRAEAARALWKAPRTFGVHAAAAETLAVVLERRVTLVEAGREVWLALDAAAGIPSPRLLTAARLFAASSPDTALARVARDVVRRADAAGRP